MTPSRLFIVLLRALGVYLIAVYGAAAIMHAAGLLNVAGFRARSTSALPRSCVAT